LYFGVHYFERWRQSEVEKLQLALVAKDAQLNGLISQLQPHFLFNCLNSVRALIVEDPAKAQTTVTALSSLMRYSLQATRESTVPLATEIDMVRTYLALEAVRFDERLVSELAIAGDTETLHVPPMLVQSLVENGVKHGIERSQRGGTIRVATWREAGSLRIRVSNPGQLGGALPASPVGGNSTRIGLANARERLRLLFPGASLALRDADHTVTADVTIPLGADA
ncbi:MAG: histidine kinase, partial [Kofleriaceae bacterium]